MFWKNKQKEKNNQEAKLEIILNTDGSYNINLVYNTIEDLIKIVYDLRTHAILSQIIYKNAKDINKDELPILADVLASLQDQPESSFDDDGPLVSALESFREGDDIEYEE